MSLLLTVATVLVAPAAEVKLGKHQFQLPDGFAIEQIAGPPRVDRPICGSLDEHGRLYVADSSGSNEDVNEQVKNPTHRIVRLEDADGDGKFEKSTVFADRMMFPEGTLWYDGSLYVAAPPTIWKLTDTDNDGVADKREEWWQGKTLTHCANDLHGPYLGPDGWFYWCKGAFAEQTYERDGKPPFVTKAAHIFRCRPDAPRDPKTGSVLSSAIEPVMTGGMANPVDVTFTPGGERIFTTTFLTRPQAGLRDGLIHAIYGGVYGMNNESRLSGHKRTGDLMPPLLHMGAAAPCGLTRYESNVFGKDYRDNLFTCLFNMRKVTRHVLQPNGGSFKATMEDFLVSKHLDFHLRFRRFPSHRCHRRCRWQLDRDRHGWLVQTLLSNLSIGKAGCAGSDLPCPPYRCSARQRPPRTQAQVAGIVGRQAHQAVGRRATCSTASSHPGIGRPRFRCGRPA